MLSILSSAAPAMRLIATGAPSIATINPMSPKDDPAAPRMSAFGDRLARRATMVASTREGYETPLHAHDCDMLFVPLAGRFDVIDGRGEAVQSSPGDFVWFAAGAAHATASQTLKQTHIAVYVDPDFWSTALRAQGVQKPPEGMRAGSAALNALSQKMLEVARAGQPGDDGAVYCGALIMEAARLSANPVLQTRRTPAGLVAALLADAIQADLSQRLSLDDFAMRHRLSRRQVERMFRAEFGLSPLAFQQIKRADRARYLLANTQDSVLSIAQQVGWESGSYLARVLAKTWAITAAEIRASRI
jgi:AraC-like DNA-binding protein